MADMLLNEIPINTVINMAAFTILWSGYSVLSISCRAHMGLTFRRGRFSLRGQQHSRSFYIHPSTPPLLASCSWQKKYSGGGGTGSWEKSDGRQETSESVERKTQSKWGLSVLADRQGTKHKNTLSWGGLSLLQTWLSSTGWNRNMWTSVCLSSHWHSLANSMWIAKQSKVQPKDILLNFHCSLMM